jgi:polysaccharide deacetylase 2 family uncharacterized protein YibQ
VAPDDLNAPLGQTKRKPPRRFGAPQIVAALLATSGIVVAGWAAFVNDPLGGEPTAVVAIKAVDGKPAAHISEAASAEAAAAHAPTQQAKAAPPASASPVPFDAKTVTIIDGASGNRQEVVVPEKADKRSSLNPANANLLEPTKFGAIPKVGPDGARAATVYAKPRVLPAAVKDFPRIAIVVAGLGISAAGTSDAFALPTATTFAVAPYAADVEKLAERARADGHEVLLQIPMEPYDYPNNDPGPQTLLTSLTPEQNIERLHWLMGRLQGYVGLAGSMGARFAASEQALRPVLTEAAQRGLMYLDDGASTRSTAGQIAGAQNMPFAKANVVLDAGASPRDVDRALARLELAARDNGSAVGIANAQSGAIARIAAWAKQVESRGFVLVPISMVANGPRGMQRAANGE